MSYTTSEFEEHLKVVIVGDGAVGKTALFNSYCFNIFEQKHVPTVVDMYKVTLTNPKGNGGNIICTIYDTAGQEDFKEIRNLNLDGADSVIICFSVNSITSFDNVRTFWVNEVKNHGINSYVLCATKRDLFKDDGLCIEFLKTAQMAAKIGAKDFVECSAKMYTRSKKREGNVGKVFKKAIREASKARAEREKKPESCLSCVIL